jgi:hypothetical protein
MILIIACLTFATEIVKAYEGSIDNLGWISGTWTGQLGNARIEEIWSHPEGGSMIGMFRLTKHREPGFYEFMSVELVDGRIALKLRHFDPGLVAWEDKDHPLTLFLEEIGDRKAVFRQSDSETRLRYHSPDEQSLVIILEERNDSGPSHTEFRFTRAE